MQDNSLCHMAQIVRDWVNNNNINVLLWPAKSLDVNLIENLCRFMVKNIYQGDFRPANQGQL